MGHARASRLPDDHAGRRSLPARQGAAATGVADAACQIDATLWARWNLARKIAPSWPFSTETLPPWAAMIVRTIGNPIPIPSFLVEKNGSNTRSGASADDTPPPVSETTRSAFLPFAPVVTTI